MILHIMAVKDVSGFNNAGFQTFYKGAWLYVARSLRAYRTGVACPKILNFSISLAITEKSRHIFTYQALVNPLGNILYK